MSEIEAIIRFAFSIFIITNPIGNSPAILTLVKDFPLQKQRAIVIREGLIALGIALFFLFFGTWFLGLLSLEEYALALCGGLLLFFVALSLIFPSPKEENEKSSNKEPFIVPIATPLLTGPSLIAIIMLFSKDSAGFIKVLLGLLIAWLGVMPVLIFTPYLQKAFGKKGLLLLEQLMGMILSFMAIEMILKGIRLFINQLS
ncbi:MarC family protein [Criblamydia sequanensis]|uniref:UPF0056 membrane protein n=1 Tax=Candidatus Criblamydia sequanensis CRIB-18 TaxID=1437425 RepID=A0A090D3C1_9BACT|nr:MarC family protein [Criblamydia sequanensis]CDR35123.1 Conserved putative membrane protein [Criblamydia sequanensis CRIB-18]